jgi:hypothetical protein
VYLRPRYHWTEIGLVVFVVLLVGLVIFASCADAKKREECREKGGRVEEYNCELQTSCSTDSNGFTSCTSYESCDWRCEGLLAEDPR